MKSIPLFLAMLTLAVASPWTARAGDKVGSGSGLVGYLMFTLSKRIYPSQSQEEQKYKVLVDGYFLAHFQKGSGLSDRSFSCKLGDGGATLIQTFTPKPHTLATHVSGSGIENVNGRLVRASLGRGQESRFVAWSTVNTNDSLWFADSDSSGVHAIRLSLTTDYVNFADPSTKDAIEAPVVESDSSKSIFIKGDSQAGLNLTAQCSFSQ